MIGLLVLDIVRPPVGLGGIAILVGVSGLLAWLDDLDPGLGDDLAVQLLQIGEADGEELVDGIEIADAEIAVQHNLSLGGSTAAVHVRLGAGRQVDANIGSATFTRAMLPTRCITQLLLPRGRDSARGTAAGRAQLSGRERRRLVGILMPASQGATEICLANGFGKLDASSIVKDGLLMLGNGGGNKVHQLAISVAHHESEGLVGDVALLPQAFRHLLHDISHVYDQVRPRPTRTISCA